MLARSRNNVVRERNAIPCRFAEIADRVSDSSRELIVRHVVPISFSTSRARAPRLVKQLVSFFLSFPSLYAVSAPGRARALIVRKIAVTAVSRRNLSRVTTVLTDVRRDILSRSPIVRTIAAAVRHGFSRNLLCN